MIGTADIEEIIRIALYTGRVEGERPLSLLIIAAVGAGKSELVSRYSERYVDSVLYATDVTAFALHKRHGKALKRGDIRHIIIPDLLTPLNKAKDQADTFITFMNGIVEEGIARVESKESNFQVELPVRCGLITTLADKELQRKKEKWASVGFLSRMLPISYSYKQSTITDIFEHIIERQYIMDIPRKLSLPRDTFVTIPSPLTEYLEPYAINTKDDNDQYGFRRLKQLQVFLMGRALMNGRVEVTEEDIEMLDRCVKFMNYSCSAEI